MALLAADGVACIRGAMKELRSLLKFALGLLALVLLVIPLTSSAADDPAPEKKLTKAQEKYDADKDGKLSDAEKAAAKEAATAKARETREENLRKALEKYDVNHNGKLDDDEKTQMKSDEQAAKEKEIADKKLMREQAAAEKQENRAERQAKKESKIVK